jgi:hypothetical protein
MKYIEIDDLPDLEDYTEIEIKKIEDIPELESKVKNGYFFETMLRWERKDINLIKIRLILETENKLAFSHNERIADNETIHEFYEELETKENEEEEKEREGLFSKEEKIYIESFVTNELTSPSNKYIFSGDVAISYTADKIAGIISIEKEYDSEKKLNLKGYVENFIITNQDTLEKSKKGLKNDAMNKIIEELKEDPELDDLTNDLLRNKHLEKYEEKHSIHLKKDDKAYIFHKVKNKTVKKPL